MLRDIEKKNRARLIIGVLEVVLSSRRPLNMPNLAAADVPLHEDECAGPYASMVCVPLIEPERFLFFSGCSAHADRVTAERPDCIGRGSRRTRASGENASFRVTVGSTGRPSGRFARRGMAPEMRKKKKTLRRSGRL